MFTIELELHKLMKLVGQTPSNGVIKIDLLRVQGLVTFQFFGATPYS